ncbi:MAG: hypothetical protein JWL61_2346 [Gemmatimonadetes bacterium]|nr:hypothetical protein [Gemmatimonadota bacterium]
MIHVDRPITKAPPDWLTVAKEEQALVETAYAEYQKAVKGKGKNRPEFVYEFKAYGHVLLRDALNSVYGFKCAYCESYFGATQPVAVEHYRPKGAFVEGKVKVKPGYFWLASAWENLLPSCTDCNSPRRQEMVAGKKVVRGKGNFFPIVPGSRRARRPGQEKNEQPLLLHPEVDQPDQHLEFITDHDRVGLVRPALVNGSESARGAASVDVYALDRPQLIQARSEHAKRLISHIRNTRLTHELHQSKPGDASARQAYEDNWNDLHALYLSPANPYFAMARHIVRAKLPGIHI